jgi:hypothetical protein
MPQKIDPRSKNMCSYEKFAWSDAISMADWLEESFDLVAVRKGFEAMSDAQKLNFEEKNAVIIQEVIGKTEGQRPAYLRKVGKNAGALTQGILIVFAIIGIVRVKEIIDLRDRFRYSLTPGGPNRATCADLYSFYQEMKALTALDWPDEVFEAIESDGGWPDDE